MSSSNEFQNAVRDALNHLYDVEHLRTSPLVQIFALPVSWQSAMRLQRILLDEIDAMRPPPDEPAASMRRRLYNILQLRYAQQFTQKEVAAQLGVGVRQYRRLQEAAVHAFALQLLEKHQHHEPGPALADAAPDAADSQLPETLQWIGKLAQDEITPIDQVVEDVVALINPLAQRQRKRLHVATMPSLSALIHPMVLRQALLNLLNAAVLQSSSDEIFLHTRVHGQQMILKVFSKGAEKARSSLQSFAPAELIITQKMVQHFNGDVAARADPVSGDFYAELHCRSVATVPILLVDDHEDTVTLLQRYMINTPYALVIVNDPQLAVEQAALHQPQVILLDVMMPEMDGWEVLSQLRQDERTARLPILVCTVLDQSELALSLGASGFLRKPIARPALLAALRDYGEASASTH